MVSFHCTKTPRSLHALLRLLVSAIPVFLNRKNLDVKVSISQILWCNVMCVKLSDRSILIRAVDRTHCCDCSYFQGEIERDPSFFITSDKIGALQLMSRPPHTKWFRLLQFNDYIFTQFVPELCTIRLIL